jgi:hypothetical protein
MKGGKGKEEVWGCCLDPEEALRRLEILKRTRGDREKTKPHYQEKEAFG